MPDHLDPEAYETLRRLAALAHQERGGVNDSPPTALRATLSGVGDAAGVDVLKLNDALEALSQIGPHAAEVVTLRAFGGLTVPEAAEARGVSPRTVNERWRYGRTWLAERLGRGGA